jgi:hypothetical protein
MTQLYIDDTVRTFDGQIGTIVSQCFNFREDGTEGVLVDTPRYGSIAYNTSSLELVTVESAYAEMEAVSSYAERYANHPEHTPFCMNLACECHDDLALLEQQAEYVDDGLLTSQEFLRTLSGLQV